MRARNGAPILPESRIFFTARSGDCQRQFSWTRNGTFAWRAAATIWRASPSYAAIGFWQITGVRCLIASSVSGAVAPHLGDVVHEIGLILAQQFSGIVVNRRNVEFARDRLGFGASAIINGDATGPFQLAPTGELVSCPETRAENRKPQLPHLGWCKIKCL